MLPAVRDFIELAEAYHERWLEAQSSQYRLLRSLLLGSPPDWRDVGPLVLDALEIPEGSKSEGLILDCMRALVLESARNDPRPDWQAYAREHAADLPEHVPVAPDESVPWYDRPCPILEAGARRTPEQKAAAKAAWDAEAKKLRTQHVGR